MSPILNAWPSLFFSLKGAFFRRCLPTWALSPLGSTHKALERPAGPGGQKRTWSLGLRWVTSLRPVPLQKSPGRHLTFLPESLPDLDECASQRNSVEENTQPQCQHLCHNYVGGYFCSCHPGYELQKDGHSCQGEVGWCGREAEAEQGLAGPSRESPRDRLPALLSQPSAAVSCTQSHRATCPAWSIPSPTPLTCAATTASGWSGATSSTSSSWSLSKSMTTSKYTALMTSYRYSHPTPRGTLPSPSHPHVTLLSPTPCWILWPTGARMTD